MADTYVRICVQGSEQIYVWKRHWASLCWNFVRLARSTWEIKLFADTVWPEISAGSLFWRIGGFESNLPIFHPSKLHSVMLSSLHNRGLQQLHTPVLSLAWSLPSAAVCKDITSPKSFGQYDKKKGQITSVQTHKLLTATVL